MNPPKKHDIGPTQPGELTHFDAAGQAHMVDIGDKPATRRVAIAQGTIKMHPDTLAVIESGSAKKGDVLGVARIAAIMAAKRTADLIPLCHPIALTRVAVDFTLDADPDYAEVSLGGGSAPSTLTVSALDDFTGSVTLSSTFDGVDLAVKRQPCGRNAGCGAEILNRCKCCDWFVFYRNSRL